MQGVKEAINLRSDVPAVHKKGLVLFCVEVVNRFEHFMMNTAAEGIAFCERVGSPNCKLLLDTFHMNIEDETNRRPPGEGRIPWPEIFGALREIDYQGAVTMEPFLVPGGEVGRDVSLYRDLLGSADRDELVTRSVQFVRSEQNKISGS